MFNLTFDNNLIIGTIFFKKSSYDKYNLIFDIINVKTQEHLIIILKSA